MIPEDKPILNTEGQIDHLLSKGVKFEIMSIDEAKTYLDRNNNYFKLRAYRKNFLKHPGGELAGKYIDLDFAMLKDLSIIDMLLRYTLIHMALDIEHFAKVKLLKAIEQTSEDGYQIVTEYMSNLKQQDELDSKKRYDSLMIELNRNKDNPYCGGIIEKYKDCYPVWAFVEIIPLGRFIDFYGFCARKFDDKSMTDEYYLLSSIKRLRNAAAHSNCIIHDMGAKDCTHKVNYKVSKAISKIPKRTRDTKLQNERMQQIVTLLYTHSVIVTSAGVHEHEKEKLHEFVDRMYKHIDYYSNNNIILSNFEFLNKVIDILFV